MSKLTLNTGAKTYEIVDENDRELGVISIYPNDLNIGNRALEAEKKISIYIQEAEKLANDKEADVIEQVTELDKKIKEQIDYLFNSKISETVFKGLHCLNVNTNGKYFIENFLDMITPVLKDEMDKSIKKSKSNVKKYTSQVIDE